MRQDVAFAELHGPIFVSDGKAGKGLGPKLKPIEVQGLSMVFDWDKRCLEVTYNGTTTNVMEGNIANWTPKKEVINAPILKPEQILKTPAQDKKDLITATIATEARIGKIKAQVSSPTSHVFEESAGKVKD